MRHAKIWTLAAALLTAGPTWAATVVVSKGAGGWALTVDGQPYVVQGVVYNPERVGESPDLNNVRNWQDVDDNRNGLLDAPYESFLDANGNGRQDASEITFGDFELMRQLGVNTIRIYHHSSNAAAVQAGYGGIANVLKQYNHAPNNGVLRDLQTRYGIRSAVGDFFGAYGVGSGAGVGMTTDYTDAAQVTRMLASVQQMVTDYKDEPFLLMYVLGNENNYASLTFTNALAQPTAFAAAVGQAVALIKSQDPNHPVAIVLGDYPQTVVDALKALPSGQQPDILGANVYRYPAFETYFSDAANGTTGWDKPVLFMEYGDQSTQFFGGAINETRQAAVIGEAWSDIAANEAGGAGVDNAIGGFAFQWLDNWWQSGAPAAHTIVGTGGFENEWHGLFSQGDGLSSPRLRVPRQAYFTLQAAWNATARTVAANGGHFFETNVPTLGGLQTVSYLFYDIPAGAFPTGTAMTYTREFTFPAPDALVTDVLETQVGFSLSAVGGAQPQKPITLSVPFEHAGAGYVIARWDPDHSAWLPLATRRDSSGALVATTDHLSLFQVMQVDTNPTNAEVIAYPNPVRPARGDTGLNFSRLRPGTDVKLYTQAGELVRRIEADITGFAFWDLRNDEGRSVSSGVYLAVIDGDGGRMTRTVAVQR